MTLVCPDCGGSQVRQIEPGQFECDSLVVVGAVPPEVTGYSHPVPDERVCGSRFRVGTSATSQTCGYCTRLSLGTCADCRRPLCHLHGTSAGPFVCHPCLEARAAAQRREQGSRQAADRAAQAEISAAVAACRDPDELVDLLTEHEGQVSLDACQAAWVALAMEEAIEPSHDIVTAAGEEHLLKLDRGAGDMGRNWRETDRAPGWHAPNVVAPCGLGAWLDAEAAIFHNGGGGSAGPSRTLFLPTTKVVLPRGEPLRLSPWLGSLGPVRLVGGGNRDVKGGLSLYPRAPEATDYALVVIDIVGANGSSRPS
jgi:hypothetical protein